MFLFLPHFFGDKNGKKVLFIIFPRMQFPVKAPTIPPLLPLPFSVHPSCQGRRASLLSPSPFSFFSRLSSSAKQYLMARERKGGRKGRGRKEGGGPREREGGKKASKPFFFHLLPDCFSLSGGKRKKGEEMPPSSSSLSSSSFFTPFPPSLPGRRRLVSCFGLT